MSRITVEMLRAYLVTASLLAMGMDGTIVIVALVVHVPDAVFEGSMFRLVALTMLVACTVAVKVRAMHAFRRAVKGRTAIDAGIGCPVLDDCSCPSLGLVIFYHRLSRREFLVRPS